MLTCEMVHAIEAAMRTVNIGELGNDYKMMFKWNKISGKDLFYLSIGVGTTVYNLGIGESKHGCIKIFLFAEDNSSLPSSIMMNNLQSIFGFKECYSDFVLNSIRENCTLEWSTQKAKFLYDGESIRLYGI